MRQGPALDVFTSALGQRRGAAGLRVLAARVVDEAAVGDVSQAQVSLRHAEQQAEEQSRRAEGSHPSWTRVSGNLLDEGHGCWTGGRWDQVFMAKPEVKERITFRQIGNTAEVLR